MCRSKAYQFRLHQLSLRACFFRRTFVNDASSVNEIGFASTKKAPLDGKMPLWRF